MNLSVWFNSMLLGSGTMILAVVSGTAVALSVRISRPPWHRLWWAASVIAFALPPFLATNGWLEWTAGSRALWTPEQVDRLSMVLAVLVLAGLTWPVTTFLVHAAWEHLEPAHLEAEPHLVGMQLIRRLLLPVARPALHCAAVMTLVMALANFTVPTLFQVRVFTEEFWVRFNTQFDAIGALQAAWPLLIMPAVLAWTARHHPVSWPRTRSIYNTAAWLRPLHSLAPWIHCFSGLVALVSVVLPLLTVLISPRTWAELGLAWSAGVGAVMNSFWVAASAAACVSGIGIIKTFVSASSPPLTSRRVVGVSFAGFRGAVWLPFFIPGIFLGLAVLRGGNSWLPGMVTQNMIFVGLIFAIRYGGPGSTALHLSRETLDGSPVEAATLAGASRWRIFRNVIWPQLRTATFAGAGIVYLLCLWDVETLVLIVPPGGETLALRIFNLLHYGHAGQVNALCLVTLGVALLPFAAAWLASQVSSWRATRPGCRVMAAMARPAVIPVAILLGMTGCSRELDPADPPLNSTFFLAVRVIGTRGVAPGQFNKPRSLVCDQNDNLYVTDMTGRVQKFSPDGRFLLQWQMPQTDLGKPKGMTLDADGNVVVLEPHYQRVNHFTPEGRLVLQWGEKGTNSGQLILPRAIGQNSAGDFFISEYTVVERVQRFGQGSHTNTDSSAGSHRGVAGWNWEQTFGSPGLSPGQFNRAEGLGIGPGDRVYVADSCNHRIQVFDARGNFLRTHGRAGSKPGDFSYPYDIRVDAEGIQYVCEFGNSRITLLDAQDRLIETIGRAGTAPGEFANPWAIALDSHGNLYVADSQNHRVQKFTRRNVARKLLTGTK
ncbi:MAG: hypothetical protein EXS36_14380 [Pedosphaera sp.]|nr:hypothetical protein [Pedosphaera sp.]